MATPLRPRRGVGLLVTALTMVLVTAGALMAPVSASAARAEQPRTEQSATTGCVAPRCFGAISFNKRTGVGAVANDKDGRRKAIRLAQRGCRVKSERTYGYPGQCVPAGSVQNGCMAVAFRVADDAIVEWVADFGSTKREAKQAAYAAVAGPGERYFAAWLCTTRHYT